MKPDLTMKVDCNLRQSQCTTLPPIIVSFLDGKHCCKQIAQHYYICTHRNSQIRILLLDILFGCIQFHTTRYKY